MAHLGSRKELQGVRPLDENDRQERKSNQNTSNAVDLYKSLQPIPFNLIA